MYTESPSLKRSIRKTDRSGDPNIFSLVSAVSGIYRITSVLLGNLDTLKEMYAKWPFFQSTMELIEAVMAKVDIDIVKLYQKELVTPDLVPIGDLVFAELHSTIAHVKMVARYMCVCVCVCVVWCV